MSEYKNGLNSMGNMSVGKDDISHDPVTGRAVFIDDARYDADSVYKAKVDGLIKQGFHKVSEGSGGGSGDFSMAQVTFINADMTTLSYSATVTAIKDNGIEIAREEVLVPVTVTVPLYKGVNILPLWCMSNTDGSYVPTTDGSIVFDSKSRGYVVTGDGSITAKGLTAS